MNADAPRKRFYARVKSGPVESNSGDEGFGVWLDDNRLRTPKKLPFVVPTARLADLCAGEWERQGEDIAPVTMPVTRLSFAAVDLALLNGSALIDHIVKYAETDLVCHRAEGPAPLVARQREVWNPILEWGEDALGVHLPVVTGVIAAPVSPDAALLRVRAEALGDFPLTGLAQAVSITGSALIAFAIMLGRLNAKLAYEAAMLDEIWNLEQWGKDLEAEARLTRARLEIEALEVYFAALKE